MFQRKALLPAILMPLIVGMAGLVHMMDPAICGHSHGGCGAAYRIRYVLRRGVGCGDRVFPAAAGVISCGGQTKVRFD
jgi:hypothetical protein